MRIVLSLAALAAFSAGCAQSQPVAPIDPFAPTRVVPPGSGTPGYTTPYNAPGGVPSYAPPSVAPGSSAPTSTPYYPQSSAQPAAAGPLAATSAPQAAPLFASSPTRIPPPATGSIQIAEGAPSGAGESTIQSSLASHIGFVERKASEAIQTAATTSVQLAESFDAAVREGTSQLRIVEPAATTVSRTTGAVAGREITDLPPARTSVAKSNIVLASHEEPAADSPKPKPVLRDNFGYDPSYRWLKGRLEYSQLDRQWKLRYIPLDGDTDSYGGSVVLTNSELLQGFKNGDFVAVEGEVASRSASSATFAPNYRLKSIERL